MEIVKQIALVGILSISGLPAFAQAFDTSAFPVAGYGAQSTSMSGGMMSSAGSGSAGSTNLNFNPINNMNQALTSVTGNQSFSSGMGNLNLAPTTSMGLAPVFGMGSGYTGVYNVIPWAAGPGVQQTPASSGYGGSVNTGGTAAPGDINISSQFAQNHPRRTEVLERANALNNTINQDYGSLGGNYGALEAGVQSIQQQEQSEAQANGGFITQGQMQQLNQRENQLQQQINQDHN